MKKTYIVPVIHHVTFGLEVEVEAESVEAAKKLAVEEEAAATSDGYDWDRFNFERVELGTWQKIAVVKKEVA